MMGRQRQESQHLAAHQRERRKALKTEAARPLNHEHERLRVWFSGIRFRKKLFGGVDEADVWKKLAEVHALYEVALSAERARYDALLQQAAGGRLSPNDSERSVRER